MIVQLDDRDDPQRYRPPYPLSGEMAGQPAVQPSAAASGSGPGPSAAGAEARAELFQSHAFLNVGEMLRSFDASFVDRHLYQSREDGGLFEEYTSRQLRVIYYSKSGGRDELGVCWIDAAAAQAHDDARLLEITHQLVNLLGGGANFRLEERTQKGGAQ
jgi:hypothetical protein